MESTKDKTCLKGAHIEAIQNKPLYMDISICGDWCANYSTKYDTCIDYALKEAQIQKLVKE